MTPLPIGLGDGLMIFGALVTGRVLYRLACWGIGIRRE